MLIHELSQKLGITPRSLRFYEEKGLLAPLKHKENGYRTYTDEDAWRVQTIISLREIGMPIEEIKKALHEADNGGPGVILYALELQRSLLFHKWTEMKQAIETMDTMIQTVKNEESLPTDQLYELAQHSKTMRDLRNSWRDHWNFDGRAGSFDEMLLGNPVEQSNSNSNSTSASTIDGNHLYNSALQRISDRISPAPGESGLDIGTGTGNLAGRLLNLGATMSGIDQSKEMLRKCSTKYPQLELKLGNVLAIPYMDAQFDFIVSSFALHHFTDEQRPLIWEGMLRVLKPGGRMCVADYMIGSEMERDSLEDRIASLRRELPLLHNDTKLYANLAHMELWFKKRGCHISIEALNSILHIVYVEKIGAQA
jgi:DNA-binding transcriptional MerR regulator/phospholipid N-methyltransferase